MSENTTPMSGRADMRRNLVIGTGIAAIVIIVGSVLPWATVSLGDLSESVGGMDGDGAITLVLGLLLGAFAVYAYLRGAPRGLAWAAAVVAAIVAVVAIIDIADVSSLSGDLGDLADVSVGFGLWLVLIGGIAGTILAAALALRKTG